MKKNKKNILNGLVFKVLTPLLLLFFWVFSSLIFNSRTSFSVLEHGNSDAVLKGKIHGKLYKNEKIEGEFTAKENNLGMVMIRFNDFVLPDYRGEDDLLFKLKEKGKKDWYYFNSYRSGLLKRQLLFPFGFPIISESKGKAYEFELQSLYGNSTNAVELSGIKPIVKTTYQFPRKEIAGSKMRIIKFLPVKIINSFTNIDFLLSSVTYLLPFALYFFMMIFFIKKTILSRRIFTTVLYIFILTDLVVLRELYTGIFTVLVFWYAISMNVNKVRARTTFILTTFLIIFWIFLVSVGNNVYSLKLNVWVYALFLIGTFQLIVENKRKK